MFLCNAWSHLPGLNRGPTVYKTVALPAELRWHDAMKTMGRQGFAPWKAEPPDLQSGPFDYFGTCPFLYGMHLTALPHAHLFSWSPRPDLNR